MGNLVPSSGGGALAAYGGANPWAEAARGVETGAYLKFNGNDGRYSFGQDDEDLPEGSRVVADMESLALGWICWVDSEVAEEILVPVVDGKAPMEHELTDHGPYNEDDGWRSAASISCVLESYGDDDRDEAVGTKLLWKTSTSGQVRSLQKLSGAFGRVFTQHPGEFPVVELGVDSYAPKNKKHGKIKYSPNLKIVGWMTAEELEGLAGSADGEDDYEEPAARTPARREPEPEPEPAPRRGRREQAEEPADEAPRGRGRRQEPEQEPDEAPAPRRGGRAAPPADEDDGDEAPAPTPRGRSAGRRQQAEEPAGDDDQGGDDEAPATPQPRGRSAGRGAAPANARLRRFD